MNPSIRQAEAGRSLSVPGQLSLRGAFQAELQSDTLSQNKEGKWKTSFVAHTCNLSTG